MKIVELSEENKKEVQKNILQRSPSTFGAQEATVRSIIEDIKARGDEAVFEYTKKFDRAEITGSNFQVTEEEIRAAYKEVPPETSQRCPQGTRKYPCLPREAEAEQLDHDHGKRNHSRAENHAHAESRSLCTRRKSSISFIRTDEHRPRQGCGCRRGHHDNPLQCRGKGESCRPCCRQ